LSNSIYSDEELQQIRQLELQVQELSEENAALLEQQKALRKHTDQLELVLKHQRDRTQEAQLELQPLREDFQRAQEAVSTLTDQLNLAQDHLHEATVEINKVQVERQDAIEELNALKGQFSILKTKILAGQEALKAADQENRYLDEQLIEKSKLFNQLEIDVDSIKQALTQGLLKTKEIESSYLEVVQEKAALYNKSSQTEHLLEHSKAETNLLQEQLNQALSREKALKEQLSQLEHRIQAKTQEANEELLMRIQDLEISLQKHHRLLHEKELEIEDSNTQILQLAQEKLRLEDSQSILTRHQDEQEARLKVAQQHLGKKVKEVALMNEKMDDQKSQITELQASLNLLKVKMSDMQGVFEQQLQQEKKLQEQLHESVRFAEGQVIKWEEKYLKSHEKLKILEEKQHQMQSLFASLGNVMGASSLAAQFPAPYPSVKNTLHLVDTQSMQNPKEEEAEPPAVSFQPSLFDIEQPRAKMRQNLFD
jgi:chromosome segregation ATPase